MPIYLWKCGQCGKETTVIRHFSEIDEEPTEKESECDCEKPEWERIMCSPTNRWRYND